MTKVTFLVKEQNVSVISTDVNGISDKGGGTYFHLGGGGGGKDKKGHYNVKKGTYDAHADNITNVLIKHPCRYKVSFYMRSVIFLAGGTE